MTGKGGLQVIKESKGKSFCEAYKKPLQAIEKELKILEFLKSHLDMEVIEDTLYIENGAITITPLSQDTEKLLKGWLNETNT